jgi:hypothetical protein
LNTLGSLCAGRAGNALRALRADGALRASRPGGAHGAGGAVGGALGAGGAGGAGGAAATTAGTVVKRPAAAVVDASTTAASVPMRIDTGHMLYLPNKLAAYGRLIPVYAAHGGLCRKMRGRRAPSVTQKNRLAADFSYMPRPWPGYPSSSSQTRSRLSASLNSSCRL